jgi:hypothetical protein
MAKGKPNKKQHFIPRAYLSAWTDPSGPAEQEPYLWLFPKEGGKGRRKAPVNVFTETDMYTVQTPEGERNLYFEHGLAQLETGLKRIREDFLELGKQLPAVPRLKLTAFLSALHTRTPRFRDHHRDSWQKVLNLGEEMEEAMRRKTPEERQRISSMTVISSAEGAGMSMEDVRRIVTYPIQHIAPAAIEAELPFLLQMKMLVLCAPVGSRFITSDAPVVWFDPESRNRPLMWQGPGLMYETLEISMPISPRQLILITHDRPMSRGVKPMVYVDVNVTTVLELNRRTRAYAHHEVVVNQNQFDPKWALLKPPIDGGDIDGGEN